MSKKTVKITSILDDDGEEETGFSVNKAFAERYDSWRRKEETQKMKDKYGEDYEEEEESDSEESDDGADWDAEDEKDFLKTLSALKGEDEKIYNKETRFWHEKKEGETSEKKEEKKDKKDKPMFLKDYERELVKRGGDIDESDDDVDGKEAAEPGYHEKQERNRKALKAAFGDDEEDEDGEDLFKTKEKTEEEKAAEEEEYYEWIGGGKEKEISEKEKKELKGLKKAWNSSSMDDDEKFLRDYILNKKYDTDSGRTHIPSYEEIVGTTLEEDEEEEEKGRDYERKYNFRFEEPDQEFIKQHPRKVVESVREGVNSKRKEQREDYKDRKIREKEEKKAEIKQLKRAKKSEIEKQLEKLKKMAGDDIALKMEDLEGDFDPKEYDRRMQELFNSSYYDQPMEEEGEKPVFSDLSDDDFDGDSSDDYDGMTVRGGKDVDDDDEEEGEVAPTSSKIVEKKPKKAFEAARDELRKDKESTRRRRRRNEAFVAAVKREKPVFDPKEKTFEEYFNEYYALDYEDIIGDTVTKFKYRAVPANSFGLSTEEIMAAEDRQLNAWASLKKAVAYRTDKEEAYDINAYKRKGADEAKKRRILSIDFGGKKSKKLKEEEEKVKEEEEKGEDGEEKPSAPTGETAENGEGKKKRRNRKKNKGKKETEEGKEENGEGEEVVKKEEEEEAEPAAVEVKQTNKEKKKTRNRKRRMEQVDVGVSDDRLMAYGINVKKFKGNKFYAKKKEGKQE